MEISIKDITGYMDFISTATDFHVSIHGDIVFNSELIRYNVHLNPYCYYIKNVCEKWQECIDRQSKVTNKAEDGSFFGVCYAGVGEFVYPVNYENRVVGFISVNGYAPEDDEKMIRFASGCNGDIKKLKELKSSCLKSEIPPKEKVDAVINPLKYMLEKMYFVQKAKAKEDDLYAKIMNYILLNHTRKITVQDIAENIHYSVSSVSHIFRRYSGKSISEYVKSLRMDKAKWLLDNSGMSVLEIADTVGYGDPGYFSTVFKSTFGISPKEYQINNRQNKEERS